MKESVLQKKMITYIEEQGGYVVKVIAASKSGVPDLLICYKSKFVGIEVKAPGKLSETRPLQKYNLQQIQKSGGISASLDSLEDLKELLCRL